MYESREVLNDFDGHAYAVSVDVDTNGYTKASVDHIFPVDDCLNPMAYGIKVVLWRKKPDFDNIPMGESHYDFDTVHFNGCPDGHALFRKKTPKTIAKKYVGEALETLA